MHASVSVCNISVERGFSRIAVLYSFPHECPQIPDQVQRWHAIAADVVLLSLEDAGRQHRGHLRHPDAWMTLHNHLELPVLAHQDFLLPKFTKGWRACLQKSGFLGIPEPSITCISMHQSPLQPFANPGCPSPSLDKLRGSNVP